MTTVLPTMGNHSPSTWSLGFVRAAGLAARDGPRCPPRGRSACAAADATALALPGLAYADGRYDDYPAGSCPLEAGTSATTVCSLTGGELASLPCWSEKLGGDYALPAGRVTVVFHADSNWRASYNGDPTLSQYTFVHGYNLTNASIAVRLHDGLEDPEFAKPKAAVEAAGAAVTVIGLETGEARTNNNDLDPGSTYRVDKAIGDVTASDFDAPIVPGGCVGADKLRASDDVSISSTTSSRRRSRSARSAMRPGCWSRPTRSRAAPSPRSRRCRPTSRTPAAPGSTRKRASTGAWSPAATPTTCPPSAPGSSRNSARANTPGRRRAPDRALAGHARASHIRRATPSARSRA